MPSRAPGLVLYTRPGCHLCEDMLTGIARVTNGTAVIRQIDISLDPTLEREFGDQIPVLYLNGRRVAKYRISDDALRRLLERET